MLDRMVVKEFLEEELKDTDIEIPEDISEDVLVETFSKFVKKQFFFCNFQNQMLNLHYNSKKYILISFNKLIWGISIIYNTGELLWR